MQRSSTKLGSVMSIRTAKHILSRPSLARAAFSLGAVLLTMVAVAPASAQDNTATTMTPPAPNASSYTYQSRNSLPEGAATSTYKRPGAAIATTRTRPPVVAAHPLPRRPS